MAKNKNQKQERRQQPVESRSAEARGPEQVKTASMAPQQEMLSADTPSTSKKKQKKLGHN